MKNLLKTSFVALVLAASFAACNGNAKKEGGDTTVKVDSTVKIDSTVKTDSTKVDTVKKDTVKK
jgi:hypothetical protein